MPVNRQTSAQSDHICKPIASFSFSTSLTVFSFRTSLGNNHLAHLHNISTKTSYLSESPTVVLVAFLQSGSVLGSFLLHLLLLTSVRAPRRHRAGFWIASQLVWISTPSSSKWAYRHYRFLSSAVSSNSRLHLCAVFSVFLWSSC